MENATKALLIAGSVLIAILLIAMGIRIFSSTTGMVDSAQTTSDATQVAIFNGKFNEYIGAANISGSKIISLQQKIIASNATNSHKIGGNLVNKDTNQPTDFVINQTKKYNVTYHPDSNGYIDELNVEEVK